MLTSQRISVSQYKYLRQSIELIGNGSALFSRAVEAVKMIHEQFDRQFEEESLEQASFGSDEEAESIQLSNRYFT